MEKLPTLKCFFGRFFVKEEIDEVKKRIFLIKFYFQIQFNGPYSVLVYLIF
jgi:hypothetical protein